jgi:hypothetical protein
MTSLDPRLQLRVFNAARGLHGDARAEFIATANDVLRGVLQPTEFDVERAIAFARSKVATP